jgi:hypothetical protein
MPNRPPLPRQVVISNVGLGTHASSSAAVMSTIDTTVTAQIVGDSARVFQISQIETQDLVREADGQHGSIFVWETALKVNGPGPIQVEAGQAVMVFVDFACPPDPPTSAFRATVVLAGLGNITILATADLGRVEFFLPSTPVILPGQTEALQFQILSSLGHEVSGVFSTDLAFEPHFSSDPQFPTIPAGATVAVTLPVTCAAGTSPGTHLVRFHLHSADNSIEFGSTENGVIVARSAEVLSSLPPSFGLERGASVHCVIRAKVTGGPAEFTVSHGPLPSGLSVTPDNQTVAVDGVVFVGLDISVDAHAPVGSLPPVALLWTVRDPELDGQLPMNIEVTDSLPHALMFNSGTLGPSTVTASAIWMLSDDGVFSFQGSIHESGVIGHEYGFGMALNVTDANGVGFAVVHSGSIGPKLPFGNPNDSWKDVGFDQRIKDNWAAIASSATRSHAGLNVDSRVLLAIVDALGVPVIAVLAVLGANEAKNWECDSPQIAVVPGDENQGIGIAVSVPCHRKES